MRTNNYYPITRLSEFEHYTGVYMTSNNGCATIYTIATKGGGLITVKCNAHHIIEDITRTGANSKGIYFSLLKHRKDGGLICWKNNFEKNEETD